MINIDAFIMQLLDFGNMPTSKKTNAVNAKLIDEYISQFPDVCRYYIEEASDIEQGQLKIDPESRFGLTPKLSDSGNNLLSVGMQAIKAYPDGEKWSFDDLVKMLNLLQFDAALYLFSAFYAEHRSNYKFVLDFKKFLTQNSSLVESPFIRHFYNVCRLFSLNEVNRLSQTNLIAQFNRAVVGH